MNNKNYMAIRKAWYQLTAEFEPENERAEIVARVLELRFRLDDLLCAYENARYENERGGEDD